MFHTILPDSNPVAITTVTRRKQSESEWRAPGVKGIGRPLNEVERDWVLVCHSSAYFVPLHI